MKKILSLLILATCTMSLVAKPQFQSGRRYQIKCEQYSSGCTSIGSAHGKQTPVYYLENGGTTDDCYWYITEEEPSKYSIQNASTGEYISLIDDVKNEYTYISNGNGNDIRYVHMTQGLDENYPDKSLWTITVYSGNYFSIRNVYAPNHLWDLRVSPSFVVGTYDRADAPNQNQRFAFYDEYGNVVPDVEETTAMGYDVSSWLVANTNGQSSKWDYNNDWSYNTSGNYTNGEASVVYPFYEIWCPTTRQNWRPDYGTLDDCSLSQTLQNLPAGNYTLQADMIAVLQGNVNYNGQYIGAGPASGVFLFANDSTTDASTEDVQPQRYTVEFTIGNEGTVTLGARTQNAIANWVAIDNIHLYYNTTEDALITGELAKLRADAEGKMSATTLETRIAQTDGSFEQLEALRQEITLMSNLPTGFNVSSWLVADTEADSNKWDNNGWGMAPHGDYHNGDASVVYPFYEKWNQYSWGPLANCSLSQTISNLPAGVYTLQADMIAVLQGDVSYNGRYYRFGPASGVSLFANDNTTNARTVDGVPERYTIDFTVGNLGTVTIGARTENTTANWIALDNIALYYHCTDNALITGELAKVRADLSSRLSSEEIEARIAATDGSFEELEQLRKTIMNMPDIGPLASCAKDITIKGRTIFYIDSPEKYMCSISEKHFGTNFTDTIAYTSINGYGTMSINGTPVASGETYTFENVEAGKTYTISFSNGSETVSYPLTFTSLPIVRINGAFQKDIYNQGYITVAQPNKKKAELLNMKAKWRGGITNGSDKHKRNYHVKLLDENGQKLEKRYFDLRKDNSWILESCQVDMSRIRNRVLTDLWNDYRTDPYYIDQEPEALTGTRGEFVELILDDEYRGIYCMTENMDRKQMKLKKYDEATSEVHGQLWKSKDWCYATFMGTIPDHGGGSYYPKYDLSPTNEDSETWDHYDVKYPDIEDVRPTDWSTLYNAVYFVCKASDEEFKAHFSEYFDMPVFIDYYILMETILSTDNHGKNMFFAVYDKQEDKKITFGVWDMDATCGQRWSDDYYHQSFLGPEQDYATFIDNYEHGDYNLFLRLRNTDPDNFNQRVAKRYRDLRQNNLATDSILRRFQNYFKHFKTAGADQRESAKWSGDSDIAGHTLNFYDENNTQDMNIEYNYLTDWFTRRMNYLDTYRFDIDNLQPNGDVDNDYSVTFDDVRAIANHILGRPNTGIFNPVFADANGDGHVTIADVTTAVNLALGRK